MIIESLQNEKIKTLSRLLSKNAERRKQNIIIIEGVQENNIAKENKLEAISFYLCPEIYTGEIPDADIIKVSSKVYQSLAYRASSEGIIGLYKEPKKDISNYHATKNAKIVVLESIEKPGNLGAILRSCEAMGIEAVIITDPKTDFYNPNVIRSSVGCVFAMKTFACNNHDTLAFLQDNNFQIITTFMDEHNKSIDQANLKQKTALCFGTEHSGLSDFWLHKGENFLVPMSGKIDSLNLSNAVAIFCYEALRQSKATN